jgi:D-alanine-D-alanine ligase-like ATP-grasp enzyme
VTKIPNSSGTHYLEQAIHLALAKNPKPGVHHVIVEHEVKCPVLNGDTQCTCEPAVTICEGEA